MHSHIKLYRREQVYQLDQLAMQQDNQSSRQLMGRAALAVWRAIQQRWPAIQHVVVFAGNGNNGGDAFALASLIKKSAVHVDLICVGDLSMQSPEAVFYREAWQRQGGSNQAWPTTIPDCDLIVDGLLGIGLSRALDSNWVDLVTRINTNPAPKVSIDIPSGLNANSGVAMPVTIQAELSVTFIARKLGCYLADGPDYCGELVYDDLGLSSDVSLRVEPDCVILDPLHVQLPAARKNNSHKNQYGHVLVIGGDRSMNGAAGLCAMAALKSGAGLVSMCVHPDNYAVAASRHMELMVSDWDALVEKIEQASVLVVGPGLGKSVRAQQILRSLQDLDKPMVIDADALQVDFISAFSGGRCVLTPHPGEAARLLECTTHEVQQDRLGSLYRLMHAWPQVSVLKGAGTLTGSRDELTTLCRNGHPGMATAGTGDVLAGIIAGYLAQGLGSLQAAQTGVLVHALAAEQFALEQDAASLVASDLINRIGLVVRNLHNQQSELA